MSVAEKLGNLTQRGAVGKRGIPLSAGMMLVAIGVVYGDIGTSPMYTMKSVVNRNGGIGSISENAVIGALSLIIWSQQGRRLSTHRGMAHSC